MLYSKFLRKLIIIFFSNILSYFKQNNKNNNKIFRNYKKFNNLFYNVFKKANNIAKIFIL